jgi:oligopeptide/dipeptide ABC transporter ATP-binding protein
MYAGRIVETGTTLEVFDRPAHPYTQALLRCLPDVDLRHEQLVEIGGQPPDLATLPPGCPFAPRCPKRQPVCDESYPAAVTIGDGHTAHCWMASPGDFALSGAAGRPRPALRDPSDGSAASPQGRLAPEGDA